MFLFFKGEFLGYTITYLNVAVSKFMKSAEIVKKP